MSECNHQCETCQENCAERDPKSFLEKPHPSAKIKKVIGVVSGKGGVGKSLVTSLLAVEARRENYQSAILDADITGPSIPKMFGLKDRAVGNESGIYPVLTRTGIKVISLNLLIENETDPVVWRGPVIAGAVKQFWTDVIWEDVDFMFVDMPPGTGDVPLTVYQSLPIDGIVIVTSPQELVSMIEEKAVNMASMMNIPILGIVENMSYVECPDCQHHIHVFGDSHIESIAQSHQLDVIGKIPLQEQLASLCDQGNIEVYHGDWLDSVKDIFNRMMKD